MRGQELVRRLVHEIHRVRDGLLADLRVHARFEVPTPQVAPPHGELIQAEKIDLLSLMDHTPGQGQYRDIEQYVGFISKWRRVSREHVEEELRARIARAGNLEERWALARDVAPGVLPGNSSGRGVPPSSPGCPNPARGRSQRC